MIQQTGIQNGAPERTIDDLDLSAFVDGELEDFRKNDVQKQLKASSFAARRVAAFRNVDRVVNRYADALSAAEMPARLCVRRMAAAARAKRMRFAAILGLACLLAFTGFGAGWAGHGLFHSQTFFARTFAEHAAAAHAVYTPDVRRPVELGPDESAVLAAWISKRLGQPVTIPDLSAAGYEFLGGRLLPGRLGAPAAQAMYAASNGKRLTLYLSENRSGQEAAFRWLDGSGFEPAQENITLYWLENRMAFALSGPFERQTLEAIAGAVIKAADGT